MIPFFESIMVTLGVVLARQLCNTYCVVFFFQAEDGIRDLVRSRGLGDVYKRQPRTVNPFLKRKSSRMRAFCRGERI